MSQDMKVLRDSHEALSYLNQMLPYGQEELLFALQNIAIAQGGFTKLAENTGLSREHLYKILTPSGNPHLQVFLLILNSLGFDLKVVSVEKDVTQKAKKNTPIRLNSIITTNPALAEQWHPTKNIFITPNDVTPTSRKKIWWRCPVDEAHEWQDSACSRMKKFKSDFLKHGKYTEADFVAQLKQGCPLCCRDKK